MTGKEIVEQWLKEKGFDGLHNPDTDCDCSAENLLHGVGNTGHCGYLAGCNAGYRTPCKDKKYEWCISPEKPIDENTIKRVLEMIKDNQIELPQNTLIKKRIGKYNCCAMTIYYFMDAVRVQFNKDGSILSDTVYPSLIEAFEALYPYIEGQRAQGECRIESLLDTRIIEDDPSEKPKYTKRNVKEFTQFELKLVSYKAGDIFAELTCSLAYGLRQMCYIRSGYLNPVAVAQSLEQFFIGQTANGRLIIDTSDDEYILTK